MSHQPPRFIDRTDLEPDPVIEAYKQDIDRTLLRESLGRTVDERMADLLALGRFADEVHAAGVRAGLAPHNSEPSGPRRRA